MSESFKEEILNQLKPLIDNSGLSGVKWPSSTIQSQYTGASGDLLLARTVDFVLFFASIFPTVKNSRTKGLDYGVGFGRIASVVPTIFPLTLLDCVDAWPASIKLARSTGLKSDVRLVNSVLSDHELKENEYDYCYAYSIFTHLSRRAFINNLEKIVTSLKPGGKFIFTVRSEGFIDFLDRSGKLKPEERKNDIDGFWFGNKQTEDYGDTIVTEAWLLAATRKLGQVSIHGAINSEPFQVVVSLTKA